MLWENAKVKLIETTTLFLLFYFRIYLYQPLFPRLHPRMRTLNSLCLLTTKQKLIAQARKLSHKQRERVYSFFLSLLLSLRCTPHRQNALFFCAFSFTLFQKDEKEKKLFVLSLSSSYSFQNKRRWRWKRISDAKRKKKALPLKWSRFSIFSHKLIIRSKQVLAIGERHLIA